MIKKKKTIEIENALLLKIYDLILNPETCDDERSKLVKFKNAVENGKDFEQQLMYLAEDLRQLAVYKFKDKKTLTPEVGKLYMDISSTGFLRKELGRGMVAISFLAK